MMEDGVRRSEVFRYLGYGNRVPDEETGELAEECIKELLRVSEERICVREFPVTVRDGSLDCGCFQTSSRSLLKNLGGCARVLVMAATLGREWTGCSLSTGSFLWPGLWSCRQQQRL